MPAASIRIPRRRINVRLAALVGVVVLIAGCVGWLFLKDAFGGFKQGDVVDLQKMVTSFTFDDMRGTEMDVPKEVRALNGQTVEMKGEIVTTNSSSPYVSEFTLVYSIAKCCNGTAPQIQHFIRCRVPNGGRLEYYPELVRVRGKLFVEVRRDETGRVTQVFRFDVDRLERA